MTEDLDILWFVCSVLLALVALKMLARGMFADRPRGRDRCPKCWYDMSSRPVDDNLRCSECGHRARVKKQLRRTRRRYAVVLLGLIVLFAALGVGLVPKVQRDGIHAIYPTTFLILEVPEFNSSTHPGWVEFQRRYAEAMDDSEPCTLWSWQRTLLAHRCGAGLAPEKPAATWFCSLEMLHWLGPDGEAAVAQLREVLASGNTMYIPTAVAVLEGIGPPAAAASPELLAMLEPDVVLNRSFSQIDVIEALGRIGADDDVTVNRLIEIANEPPNYHWNAGLRDAAIQSLGQVRSTKAIPFLEMVLQNQKRRSRIRALESLMQIYGDSNEDRRLLLFAIRDPEISLREAAADIIKSDDEILTPCRNELIQALESQNSAMRVSSTRALMTLGPSAEPARQGLLQATEDADHSVRIVAIAALRQLGPPDAATKAAIDKALQQQDSAIQAAANVHPESTK